MTRVIVVTGGSRGIGRAIAERFVAEGAHVVITGRSQGRVAEAARTIGAHGVRCDQASVDDVAALAAEVGEVDVLVNNAGGNTDFGAAGDESLAGLAAAWRANLETNLIGAVLTTAALTPRPGGSVVNVGSIGAERGGGSYGAAKAALAAWTAMLSAELGPRGVTANTISPGFVEGTEFFGDRLSEARRTSLIGQTHTGRAGRPDDIAEAAFYLASPGARQITGQVLHVNGGAYTTR